MHYLKLTAVGLVCALSEVIVATLDNFARDASLDIFEELAPALDGEAVHDTKFKHTPETINTRKLDPREAFEPPGYAVTVTVTSTPAFCITATAHGSLPSRDTVEDTVQSETVQVLSNSATEAYIAAVPTDYRTPYIIPGSPVKVPGNSAVSNITVQGAAATSGKIQFPGTNTTVSTSSLSPTKSGPSIPVPTAGAMKGSSAGLLMTLLLAIFGNFLIL